MRIEEPQLLAAVHGVKRMHHRLPITKTFQLQ
jgi:hypothetical protein